MRQNWLEWTALAVSVVALVAVVGFLVVDGIADQGRPPQPQVTLHEGKAYRVEGGWMLPATVTNGGDSAAEAVVVRGTATVAGAEEESEVTLDYLPAGTDVEVTFGFTDEPDGDVSVRIVGFRLP